MIQLYAADVLCSRIGTIRALVVPALFSLAAACSGADAHSPPEAVKALDAAAADASAQHDASMRKPDSSDVSPTKIEAHGAAADSGSSSEVCGPGAAWLPISKTSAPQPRGYPNLFWTGSELLVFGELSDGGLYSVATDSWRPMASSPVNTSDVRLASSQYLLFENDNLVTNADDQHMAIYEIAANTFHAITIAGAPNAKRQGFVLAGSALFAWGGATVDANTAAPHWVGTSLGARFDLMQERWSAMSPQGAPAARLGAGNVTWTGKRLVVWGGLSGETIDVPGAGSLECSDAPYEACGRLGDGALYDPERDRWAAMTASGAPSPRSEHLLAWTGQKVLVWGGSTYRGSTAADSFIQYADGALYDPEADTWSPTAPPPFDASRVHEKPTWTGTQLLVRDGSSSPPSAWLYDPTSDAWQTVAEAPSSCGTFTAQAGSIVTRCGRRLGRLDPNENSWTMVDLPADAAEQCGVLWTGTRWFVWGGYRLGPVPPTTCAGAAGMPCDPAGPSRIETNDGWTLCAREKSP